MFAVCSVLESDNIKKHIATLLTRRELQRVSEKSWFFFFMYFTDLILLVHANDLVHTQKTKEQENDPHVNTRMSGLKIPFKLLPKNDQTLNTLFV